jgi:hypothetical protein
MCCFSHDKALFYFFVLLAVYFLLSRGSVVIKLLFYKPECRGFETRRDERIFSIYLILSAALSFEICSASNKNEYQKQNNNVSGE